MQGEQNKSRKNILLLLTILLACYAIIILVKNFKGYPGIDFYNLWGVSKVHKWSDQVLKNPYVDVEKYEASLHAHAKNSSDLRLKKADQYKQDNKKYLRLTQTPLFYFIFALLPEDYSLAFGIYQALQVILFVTSVIIMLNSIRDEKWLAVLPLAFFLAIFYGPLRSDLRVGNFNCFLLFLPSVVINIENEIFFYILFFFKFFANKEAK